MHKPGKQIQSLVDRRLTGEMPGTSNTSEILYGREKSVETEPLGPAVPSNVGPEMDLLNNIDTKYDV